MLPLAWESKKHPKLADWRVSRTVLYGSVHNDEVAVWSLFFFLMSNAANVIYYPFWHRP
jgi:hypothetical protein